MSRRGRAGTERTDPPFPYAALCGSVVPPNRSVGDEAAIDLGERQLRLKAWPTANTNTDLTWHDEKTGTLWAGDLLFERRLPTLDGSLLGWLTVLDSLLARKSVV